MRIVDCGCQYVLKEKLSKSIFGDSIGMGNCEEISKKCVKHKNMDIEFDLVSQAQHSPCCACNERISTAVKKLWWDSSVKIFVKEQSKNVDFCHNWEHITRVVNLAREIATKMNFTPYELTIVELASCLHEVQMYECSEKYYYVVFNLIVKQKELKKQVNFWKILVSQLNTLKRLSTLLPTSTFQKKLSKIKRL
jgi:hypothetical protein